MFTGIIQAIGQIKSINDGVFCFFSAETDFFIGVEVGDSIAVNGVCLTVINIAGDTFKANVSEETLNCSILGNLSITDKINLEKALKFNQGIDGHLVSGHVDGRGEVIDKIAEGKSIRFKISAPKSLVKYIAKKGSIALNGVSLTVNSIEKSVFDVNIVPHTLTATTLDQLNVGDRVNLEVDIIARHIEQLIKNK